MILRSIRVADWRCFIDSVELGPFDEGLNIIHAPNGTGKSTLFEAFRRALLDGHKVSGREVEMLRPWGRALSPKVTVEFVHGGVEYRITKQFLEDSSALLERKENGRYMRLAEGVSADEQTRVLLTQNPPGRGLARQENWGLAQILWASQGNLVLAGLSGDLIADMRSMLAAQIGGSGAGPIEKKIEDRYLEYYSPKGKLKTGKDAPLVSRLQQQLVEATEIRRTAYGSYQAFEESSRRVEDLRARRAQARRDAEEIGKAIGKAQNRADTYRTLSAEKMQRTEQLKTAEAQYNEIKQRIGILTTIERNLSEARKAVHSLEEEVPLRVREKLEREKDAARAKAALEDARKGRQIVDQAAELAETAGKFADCRKYLSDLRALTTKIRQIQATLGVRRNERSSLVAPDAKTLRAVRKLIKDRDDASSKIEASLISLEVVPQSDGLLEVIAGEEIGTRRLGAGAPTLIQGSPEVVADLPGVARLRAWGPTGSIEEHRESKSKAEKKLAELTVPYGTSDPDALEALSDRATVMDNDIAESETQLETLLSGRSLEELMQEQAAQETALNRILEQHPEWEQSPPSQSALKLQAQEVKRSFIATVENAEEAWELAQSALTATAGEEESVTSRLEESRKLCTSLESQYADLTKDGKQPQERQREMELLAMAWDAARGQAEEIQGRLAEFQVDPIAELEALETQLKGVEGAATAAREQEIREESKLEGLAAQGPYSALAKADERVAQLQQDTKAEQLRVSAIRLLRDTVAACRSEVAATVIAPVEAIATRTFQRIANPRLGRIQIGENFEPATILPEISVESVPLDNLSGGEQEQLYLATRLALAQVLRKGERQLVVLDDVLTASDSGRLARVMNVLEDAAQDLQVLILTCHPERYRALKAGRFLDLEEALQSTER